MPEENKKELSADEQMAMLHQDLAGHPVFRRLRGKLGRSLSDILEHRRRGLSPTAARDDAREFGADLGWAQGMLARLHRDGYLLAERELSRALASSWHRMLGETTLVEKTVSITFVVYHPDAVLPLFKWLKTREKREDDFRLAAAGTNGADPGLVAFFNVMPEFKEAYGDAPALSGENLSRLLDEYRHMAVVEIDRIRSRLSADAPPSPWEMCECCMLCSLDEQGVSSYRRVALGWALRRPQKEVLAAIPRAKQSRFATWQIDLPEMYDNSPMEGFAGGFGMEVGLHPESEHALWSRRYPALVSRGVQHGYGAIVMPHHLLGYEHKEDEVPVRYSMLTERMR